MTQTTKLSMKLRALATRQPKRADRLNDHANRLDRAMFAGTVDKATSMTYRQARLFYCEATGRAFDWGAEHDLEMVERPEPAVDVF